MSLKINNIGKSFEKVKALENITFDVNSGELFGLIGPDGAGKSTLFRIMASLILPDGGSCTMNGFDVVSNYKDVRRIIGYMPGRFSLYMDLSVEENLAFYARVFGTTVDENYDLIKDVYQQIEPFRKRLAKRLSGGMKQKLALSCALIHRPEILILDEPTTGVDAVSRKEFWELLKKIQQENITIVVSTPYMDEAALCDRVALIQKGRVLDVSDPAQWGEGESQQLYGLKSERNLYQYLRRIRELEVCEQAWLFGAEIHVTLSPNARASEVEEVISSWGDPSIHWYPIDPGIEDKFMKLMQEENSVSMQNRD